MSVINATVMLSADPPGPPARYEVGIQTYEPTPDRGRFAALSLCLYKGETGHSHHIGYVHIHASKAADLAAIIDGLTDMRRWLAAEEQAEELALVEEAERQMEPGATADDWPAGLAAIEDAAAPHAAAPHAEDAHADSAPHG